MANCAMYAPPVKVRAFAVFLICVPAVLLGQAPRPETVQRGVLALATQRAYLGVALKDVAAADVSSMKLPGEYGAIVTQVESDSPAAKAGLKANDVILEFGGMRVWSADQLAQLVRETPPGRIVSLRVSRAGAKLNLEASLAPRNEAGFERRFEMPRIHIETPEIQIPRRVFTFGFPSARYRLGVEVESLTPQLAAYFGVKQGKGVLVTEVEPDSPASKAGMKAGDCIVEAGSTAVTDPRDLTHALNDAKNSELTLSVVRAGRLETLTAKLEPAAPPMQDEIRAFQLERQSQALERSAAQLERQVRRMRARQPLAMTGVI